MLNIGTSSWLFVLQPSVTDPSGQLYEISKDSTWNQICNAASGIAACCPRAHITIAVPPKHQLGPHSQNLRAQLPATLPEEVRFVSLEYAPSIRVSRAHFDAQAFKTILEDAYDFIWLSEPSHVLGVKMMLLSDQKLDQTKILASVNWIDSADQPKIDPRCSFFLRQAEGVLRSDASIFNSKAAVDEFVRTACLFFTSEIADAIRRRAHVIPPSFDPTLFGRGRRVRASADGVTIVFNHRLHGLEFYRSNWERVFEVCAWLLRSGLRFRVIATDRETKEVAQRYPFVEYVDLEYRAYIEMLHEAHIGAALFQKTGMWSMSLVETMAAGCATIVPRHSGYLELAPPGYPAFGADSFAGDVELMRQLLTVAPFREAVGEIGRSYVYEHFSNATLSKRLIDLCDRLV